MTETAVELDTKDRILDAAERLFAEHGFDGTSLRTITAAAGVNLAAVNYHFRSKESLIRAVFARRLEPINRERLRLLNEYEADAGPDAQLSLERLLEIFVGPALRLKRDGSPGTAAFLQLLGQMYSAPGELARSIFREQFEEAAERFRAALIRAVPEMPMEEFFWKIHFTIGAMAHTMAGSRYLELFAGGLSSSSDVETMLRRLVAYTAAGIRAPVSEAPQTTPRSSGRSKKR